MRQTRLLAMLLSIVMLAASCGGTALPEPAAGPDADSPPADSSASDQQGYLLQTADEVDFIKWTEANGNVNGQLQIIEVKDEDASQTESTTIGFTGILEGSELSMTISSFGTSQTWTGTLERDTLTLMIPDQNGTLVPTTFQAASVEDYNQAALELSQSAAQYTAEEQYCPASTGLVIEESCEKVEVSQVGTLYYSPSEPSTLFCVHPEGFPTELRPEGGGGQMPATCAVSPRGTIYCLGEERSLTAEVLKMADDAGSLPE